MTSLLRPVCVSLAVAVLTAIVVYIGAYLTYPVTGVQVEGERMLPETQVWNSIPDRASLLTLNAGLLERRLKSNPWVKGAEVLKNWRSGIVTVEVEERRPVLKGEVGGREVVFAADGSELPRLGGAGLPAIELNQKRLESVLSSGQTLEKSGVAMESIADAGPGGVEALVEGRRVIFSGEVRPEQAETLPEIIRQNPDVPVFDLRSPERIVIGGTSQDIEPEG
ncbi:MAG TPA: FtsQ-type POTRA domain-containing protein [Rubrobacteraceae bacterium]|nr:FtsQ-type POTRA domain-containing protein [Rubrobacteraceae bacterium]